jgi:predicted nucleic acid-binding protein
MAGYFFDTSAIDKRYVMEIGSQWVCQLTSAPGHDLYLVRITGAEVVSALTRHVPPLLPSLLAQALADFRSDYQQHYQLVEVTAILIDEAMRLSEQHHLRGYDAVQLSAAIQVHQTYVTLGVPSITFISADYRLNAIASLEGLNVDNPNSHP